jgi:class 3 adenylate cyclase
VNVDAAKFCVECGTPLGFACPSCGAAHAPGQRFCADCGTALAAVAQATAPPQADQLLSAAGELRVVSVLFVDLVGFTSLSETRDAEDVRTVLSEYFDTARTIIARHGGSIEKFIGDAVMAVWGVPVAQEDDAERAVRAGLELVDAVSAFGEQVGAPLLRARAGIVTGRAAATEGAEEGWVVGDRVNTAARVQSAAEPGSVYVDDVTRSVTSSAISYRDAGRHTVKGKTEPLPLWRAERVVAGVGGTHRQDGFEGALVGRDSELRLIKELFHAGVDRRVARLVAVTGPAGVGKTRLRWESTSTSTASPPNTSGTTAAASRTATASPTGRSPRWSGSASVSRRMRPCRMRPPSSSPVWIAGSPMLAIASSCISGSAR